MALNQYIRLQTWRIRLPSFAQSNSIPRTNVIQVCGPDERGEICLRLPTQIVIRPHSFVISVDNINARMNGELLKTPAGLIILTTITRKDYLRGCSARLTPLSVLPVCLVCGSFIKDKSDQTNQTSIRIFNS